MQAYWLNAWLYQQQALRESESQLYPEHSRLRAYSEERHLFNLVVAQIPIQRPFSADQHNVMP